MDSQLRSDAAFLGILAVLSLEGCAGAKAIDHEGTNTLASPTASAQSAKPVETTLKSAAGTRRIGAAVAVGPLADEPIYAETLAREFSYVTPENAMKWRQIEGPDGQLDWSGADAIVEFAGQHGMKVKGHCLLWPNQLPERVKSLKGAVLQAAIDEHIRAEVARYKGKVTAWDVVNEAVGDREDDYRDTQPYRELGVAFIGRAFEVAHAADPEAALYYNDYGADALGKKSDRVFALVKTLLESGAPITGVGFQMHVSAAELPDPTRVLANMRRFTDLGLTVNISEMDVRIADVKENELDVERRAFHDLVAACVATPRCDAVTFWGFTDKHSWIGSFFHRDDAPLLFDGDYRKKPAYFGVLDALLGR